MKDIGRVSVFALGNFVVAGTTTLLDKTASILNLLLTVGQVGVATITILYIYKKIRAIKKTKDDAPE